MKRLAATVIFGLNLATVTGGHAQEHQTFDLLCGPNSDNFRIDMTIKRWWSKDCGAVKPLDSVGGQIIGLSTVDKSGKDCSVVTIDRSSGMLKAIHEGHPSDPDYSFQCETGSFSGFPDQDAEKHSKR